MELKYPIIFIVLTCIFFLSLAVFFLSSPERDNRVYTLSFIWSLISGMLALGLLMYSVSIN